MEATNDDLAWSQEKVRELVRDAVAWLVLLQMAQLGLLPEP
jgi:hypothetical protein